LLKIIPTGNLRLAPPTRNPAGRNQAVNRKGVSRKASNKDSAGLKRSPAINLSHNAIIRRHRSGAISRGRRRTTNPGPSRTTSRRNVTIRPGRNATINLGHNLNEDTTCPGHTSRLRKVIIPASGSTDTVSSRSTSKGVRFKTIPRFAVCRRAVSSNSSRDCSTLTLCHQTGSSRSFNEWRLGNT
jgi:hypothetical protein